MTSLTFRSATTNDTQEICRLWAAAGLGGGADVDRAEIAERCREDDGFFVVGEVVGESGDGLLGAVAMGCYDNHRGWVKRVAVDPELQGAGQGQALMAELERRFRDAGVDKLRLAVWSQNERGGAFWESQNYTELPEIRYFTKDLNSD